MRTFDAQVYKDGNAVLDHVTVALNEMVEPSGLKRWGGGFAVKGYPNIEPDMYDIVLDDQRRGKILITNIQIASGQPMRITFVGSGPLQ